MTKKDYVLLADFFEAYVKAESVYGTFELKVVLDHLATILKSNNPRFDEIRFLAACGLRAKDLEK